MKQLILKFKGSMTVNQLLQQDYLPERKIDLAQFLGISGYLKALIDTAIQEPTQRENFSKAMANFVSEHFWAGVYVGKTKPDSVIISHQEIKQPLKGEEANYLG